MSKLATTSARICGTSAEASPSIAWVLAVAVLWLVTIPAQATQYAITDLGTLGGSTSHAFGINQSGQVVGNATTGTGSEHAFLYSNGAIQDLGTLGGSFSYARGVNNSGQVVGYSSPASVVHGFLYSNGVMQDIGTLGGGSPLKVIIIHPWHLSDM